MAGSQEYGSWMPSLLGRPGLGLLQAQGTPTTPEGPGGTTRHVSKARRRSEMPQLSVGLPGDL